MNALVAGINRYRAWIDRAEFHILVASWLLSSLVMVSVWLAVFGIAYSWWWALVAFVAILPLEAFMYVAACSGWRHPDPRDAARMRVVAYLAKVDQGTGK